MKVSELQSLMAHNRTQIRYLEAEAQTYAKYRSLYALQGDLSGEYICHNNLQFMRKKISKLASLQKSLKRELKEKLEMENERNRLNRYYTNFFALLDSAK